MSRTAVLVGAGLLCILIGLLLGGAPANEAVWTYTTESWTNDERPADVTVTQVDDLPPEQRRYAVRLLDGERLRATVYHFHLLGHDVRVSEDTVSCAGFYAISFR